MNTFLIEIPERLKWYWISIVLFLGLESHFLLAGTGRIIHDPSIPLQLLLEETKFFAIDLSSDGTDDHRRISMEMSFSSSWSPLLIMQAEFGV